MFGCHSCEKTYKTKASLDSHMITHSDERPHVCNICGNTYRHESGLRYHASTHSTDRPYVCEHCGKGFKLVTILRRHLAIHSDDRPRYSCDQCDSKFTSKYNLQKHQNVHLSENLTIYSCQDCNKTFKHHSSLLYHQKNLHQKEYPHACHLCGNKYPTLQRLRSHLRRHTGEKPYQCDVCKRAFSHISNLKQHQDLHKTEYKFKCTDCSNVFVSASQLKTHSRHVHRDPHVCSVCGAEFKYKISLTRHYKRHSQQQPTEELAQKRPAILFGPLGEY